MDIVRAQLKPIESCHITVDEPHSVAVKIYMGDGAGGRLPDYKGEYDFTPSTYDNIILPTKNKSMKQDVTIQKIPQFFVTNPQGGNTLIIGEEYYG